MACTYITATFETPWVITLVFLLNMDSDEITHIGYGLTAINLKLFIPVVNNYSYRLMTFAIIF